MHPVRIGFVAGAAQIGILRIKDQIVLRQPETELGGAHHGQFAAVGVSARPGRRYHYAVSNDFFLEVVNARLLVAYAGQEHADIGLVTRLGQGVATSIPFGPNLYLRIARPQAAAVYYLALDFSLPIHLGHCLGIRNHGAVRGRQLYIRGEILDNVNQLYGFLNSLGVIHAEFHFYRAVMPAVVFFCVKLE